VALTHPPSVTEYFRRVGAEVLNFKRAMIKVHKGNYYIERALIRIQEDGTVSCSVKEFGPTEAEAAAMKAELQKVEFPKTISCRNTDGLKKITKGELFEFYDRATGEIKMVQERRNKKDGTKAYIPWVFLSTGEWVSMEPDGDLPFWKPKENPGPGRKIMIHEGAKCAAFVTQLITEQRPHPWLEELAGWDHWGMVGGALAPHRTDYAELAREAPTEVVYVCDNDQPGVSALQKVSKAWGKSIKGLTFGKSFPGSWDMAEPMPKHLFAKGGRYIGPTIGSLLTPATWATELLPNPEGKGRSITVVRAEFAEEWHHCVTPEVFIHKDWPNRILTAPEFNSNVAPFSHVDDTARLLRKEFASKAAILKYVPGQEPGIYGGTTGTYINTFCPSIIKAEAGDEGPWIDFMTGLVPVEEDRHELMRWCATLIARPDVRMMYGVLLISEMQGVGKGTLGEKVLTPLVGEVNVSFPSEKEVVESAYNYWLAHKRLAVVHEIYAGQSSKAYNSLKSCITDRYITVQKKYQANYEIESWVHIFACSNSMRAMKLSMDDRRWFVPKISEEKRPAKYWESFNRWLGYEGGLEIIKHWAIDFCKRHGAVERGADAPWSALKAIIVEEAYSPGQALVAQALAAIKKRVDDGEVRKDVFVLDTDLVALIRDALYEGRPNDRLERPATVRSVAKAAGWHVGDTRAQIKGWGQETFGGRVLALDPKISAMTPGSLDEAGRLPFKVTSAM